jgi:hypothetical protein
LCGAIATQLHRRRFSARLRKPEAERALMRFVVFDHVRVVRVPDRGCQTPFFAHTSLITHSPHFASFEVHV